MRTERNFKNHSVKALIFTLVLIACLSVQMVAYAESLPVGSIAYANVDTKLNLRQEPQGLIIGGIPKGETVTILSEVDRNGYYRVKVNKTNQYGYAYGEYLARLYTVTSSENLSENKTQGTTTVATPDYSDYFLTIGQLEDPYLKDATLVVVSEKKLNLRKSASRKGYRILYLTYGDKLQVVDPRIKNGYVLVKDISSGKTGYVDINYVVFEIAYNAHLENGTIPIGADSIPDCCEAIGCWCQKQ